VVFGSSGHLEPTKRKFSHAALRTPIASDLQALFWTQVTPTENAHGVRANIPVQGPIIGRKHQIAMIMDEIIQIPNENGIIYGPGGVGKTALLIELSRQLFDEVTETPPFKNIIWVSAKRDYYDPTLGVIEPEDPQFGTLDSVLTAMLEFLEYEDPVGYTLADKKQLVLEALNDEKTLLILDNFESVTKSGQHDIRRFFGVDVKRALRTKPDYFKVLLTSRELIPSGFHQFKLKGLDKKESKQLMQRLYEAYAHSDKQQLTNEQMDKVYDGTLGIPLVVKHCYGQVYEYNSDIDAVLRKLSTDDTKLVEYSFLEVFQLLRQDEVRLRTMLVLELSGRRLMLRQMADILSIDESSLFKRLPQLLNFQCVNSESTGADEKYAISDEAKLLSRRLVQDNLSLATEIKQQIASLAIEQRMDYSRQEHDVILTFHDHLADLHYVIAEDFLKEKLQEHSGSVLLRLHYARFLKEIKRRTEDAIGILEQIRQPSGNDQQILCLLMTYYTELEVPNYEQAHTYARELEHVVRNDKEMKTELGRFYVMWSTALKMKSELDPLKNMVRQQQYKDLADTAIGFLKPLALETAEWHHLLSQAYYNQWENKKALMHIDKAIAALPAGSHGHAQYSRLRRDIARRLEIHSRRGKAQRW
jgi:hypothetical protein